MGRARRRSVTHVQARGSGGKGKSIKKVSFGKRNRLGDFLKEVEEVDRKGALSPLVERQLLETQKGDKRTGNLTILSAYRYTEG